MVVKTTLVSGEVKKAVAAAIKAAVRYEKLTRRKLGITGEVGEVLASDVLKLKLLLDPIAAGYDALDKQGRRYQIKARRVGHKNGRIGIFSKHKFDFAVLIVFDKNYRITELWKTSFRELQPLLDKSPRRNPGYREFINHAKRIRMN